MWETTPIQSTVSPPQELVEFVRRNVRVWDYNIGRRQQRVPGSTAGLQHVTVRTFDETTGAVGDPLAAVGRDLTSLGIGIATLDPVEDKLVELTFELAGDRVSVVTRILWCRPYGPFYYSGGKFIRLQSTKSL